MKITKTDYKQYQDRVTTIGICNIFIVSQMWYNHKTEKVVENDDINISSDFHTQTDHQTAKLRMRKLQNWIVEKIMILKIIPIVISVLCQITKEINFYKN